ncbi:MAG TPA: protein kinase [Vicinamibacteria bacterium]|nr:protein kinase [Vicinamibacteria bacterium]
MGAPERIGRYPILDELGQGAMGTVYRGRDAMLDRDVAVKVMSKGLSDAHARERFLREARAAAKLQHPNIVVVYEIGEHEGAPFMVLELLEGVDLQRAIDGGIRPDPRATLPVVLQLLAGLGHAHEHGIVHRDVKPSNVFLPVGRPAKIMDFGVARLAGLGTTTTGVVVGTPNYMSPEQASSGEIDGRSDLFSAGLILYELVTGERAFQADSLVSIMYKILNEAPDLSLIPRGPEWERLRAVLTRALARRADDRYPDARAMSDDLSRALSELGGTLDWTAPSDQALLVRPRARPRAEPPGGPAAPTSGPNRPAEGAARSAASDARRPPVAALLGAAALVAAIATGAWLWLRPHTRQATPLPPSREAGAAAPDTSTPGPVPTASRSPGPTPAPRPSAGVVPPPPTPIATPAASAAPSPTAKAPPEETPPPAAAPALGVDARLQRAEDLVSRARWPEALAEARAVLAAEPRNARAAAAAQQAEAELVIEECLKNARAAIKEGDRERAMAELRRGSRIRPNDPRLLAAFKEVVQQ